MRLPRISIMTNILALLCSIFWKMASSQPISIFEVIQGYHASVVFTCILVMVI